MKKAFLLVLLLSVGISFGQTKYEKDFDEFWSDIEANYGYLDQQKIDCKKAKAVYADKIREVKTREEFVRLLENMLSEFHNGHVSLNTNLSSSNRIVPTGSDIWIEKSGVDFIIKDLRKGSSAEKSGLKIGMKVAKFNDLEVAPQVQHFLPKAETSIDSDATQYAISMLFAGTHDKPRKISVLENGSVKDYFPDSFKRDETISLLESKLVKPNVGYIKINNSLGNNALIAAFDSALDELAYTKFLILDLTETPGGGNTTVARAIMGRFTTDKKPYQQHEFDEKEFDTKRSWIEYVTPRKSRYQGKVYILVSHWTGSMGEGLAIGFDAMKAAEIIGTQMAGLIGAISNFRLSETNIGYQIPTERLYHVNGTPREDFKPKILTSDTDATWREVRKRTKID
ncbi:S41 family peptidase [Flavobacterium sp.]|uniref:S41 family peptidase n=1 Tax=Flavobacterium sp. TaxID=239 RepID=UPI0025BC2904|nr:S41 family peptidase [Flavobacterium sp.]